MYNVRVVFDLVWKCSYAIQKNTSRTAGTVHLYYSSYHWYTNITPRTTGKTLIFDNNDPISPHNPNLVCELERIHNSHIDPSSRSYKLLGILFDEHLSFNYHIEYLKSKLSKALFCINRVKNFLPLKTLITIYHSLFHSHLLYCPLIVNSASKSNIDKIFIMQKKAIRSVTNSKPHTHTEPIFSSLKILPYHKITYKAQLAYFHSIHKTPYDITRLVSCSMICL